MNALLQLIIENREATKDYVQMLVWIVTSVGAAIAAWKAIAEMRKANIERMEARTNRERDLRWRQAEAGKKLIDELLSNSKAADALRILDLDGHEIALGANGASIRTSHATLSHHLRTKNLTLTPEDLAVRERFDELLGAFDRLEHYVKIDLTLPDDVLPPFEYYADISGTLKEAMSKYAIFSKCSRAVDFLRRYPNFGVSPVATPAEGP